jgi:putative MATE family efflux protein
VSQLDRRILRLAVPALGALAADPLLSLADTAFVSRLGTAELGALGVDGSIFGFAFVLFNFLAYATTPLVAQALGRDDPQAARAVIGQSLWLAGGLGLVATVVLVAGAEMLVSVMQAGPAIREPAVAYLQLRALATPAVLVVTASHGAFRGMQDTKTPLLIALAANLINLGLDPLLIFGAGWGVRGAAAASVVAQYVAAAWFLVLLRRRWGSVGTSLPRWRDLAPFLRTGGILTARTLFLVAALAAATATAAATGDAEVAAHQVVRETWFLSAMLVDGLAIAAQALIAERVGRGDRRGMREVADRLLWWGGGTGLVMALLWLGGAGLLAAAFAPDPLVAGLIRSAAVIAGVMAPLAALVWVFDGIFLGLLRLRVLVTATGAGLVAALVVFWWVAATGGGLAGVWWGIAALVAARAAVLWPVYHRLRLAS